MEKQPDEPSTITVIKPPANIKIDAIGDTAYTHECRAMVSPRHKGTGLTDVCSHCGRSA